MDRIWSRIYPCQDRHEKRVLALYPEIEGYRSDSGCNSESEIEDIRGRVPCQRFTEQDHGKGYDYQAEESILEIIEIANFQPPGKRGLGDKKFVRTRAQ